jgi:hypothetical protein
MEKWTKAVDDNKAAVRSFMGDVVKMLASFGKLAVQGALFAVVMRVLGGVVMILQAILSPLGMILAGFLLLQTAWRNNFLGMTEAGKTAFDFLKENALGFFDDLINGAFKAVGYVINQLARLKPLAQEAFVVPKLVDFVEGLRDQDVTNRGVGRKGTAPSGQVLGIWAQQRELYAALGQTQLSELIKQHRGLYDELTRISGDKELSLAAALDKVTAAIKKAKSEVAEPMSRDILSLDMGGTRPVEDAISFARKKIMEAGGAITDQAKVDLGSLKDLMLKWLPAGTFDPLFKILDEIKGIWGEVEARIGAAGFGLRDMYKGGGGGDYAPNTSMWGMLDKKYPFGKPDAKVIFDPMIHEGQAFAERWNTIRKKIYWVSKGYEDDWKEAIGAVSKTFKTQQEVFITGLEEVHSGMVDAFDNLMQKGSSFVTFMDSVFQSVLASFRRMVAEMLANQMFSALFGGKGVNEQGNATAGFDIGGWARYFLGLGTPSTSYGGGSVVPTTPFEDIVPENWQGAGKAAATVSLNVTNNGAPVTLKQVGQPQFVGRQMVINYTMEEAMNNPRYREIIAGGR